MAEHQRNLEYFVELSLGEHPSFINEMSPEQLHQLREFMEQVLRREEEALTNMFKSMALLMKYIPNVILCPIIPRYFSPSIAAMITQELNMKQITGVISGLPVAYIGEISVYLDSELAAEILQNIKPKLAMQVIEYCVEKSPLSVLDTMAHAPESLQKFATQGLTQFSVNGIKLDQKRQETYQKIIAL
jgi:flagellar motor switch protein FliG